MNAILAQIRSNLRLTLRERTVFFFNYAFPLFFYFLFASLNKAKETNSIASVLTSVLTIGLLGNGLFGGGIRAVVERDTGILRRFKVAPPGPLPILISALVVGVLQYLPVVFFMVAISIGYYGMPFPPNWLAFLVFVILANFAMRSIGNIVASVANGMGESQVIIQCLYFPMMFLSGATFPVSILPQWVQAVAQFIPATHLVSGMQSILLRRESLLEVWKPALALVITTVACTVISLKLFRWEKTEKVPGRAKAWVLAVLAPFLLLGVWDLQSKENLKKSRAVERELARGQTTLIKNCRIFTARGQVIESGSVLVRGGKIAQIFTGATPDAKALNAIEVEAAGKTLLPGLIDVHVHLGAPGGMYEDTSKFGDPKLVERRLKAYLAAGVTSVKSTGDWVESTLLLRNRQREGDLIASELYAVGPLFTAKGGHPTQMLQMMPQNMRAYGESQFVRLPKDAADARAQVKQLKEMGVDGIKAVLESGTPKQPMPRLDLGILRALCEEAHAQGLKIVVHTSKAQDVADAFEAGADGVEHGSPAEELPDDLLRRMAEKKFFYDPTLSVFEGVRMVRERDFARLEDPLVQQIVPRDLMQGTRKFLLRLSPGSSLGEYGVDMALAKRNLLKVWKAGVPVVAGTDAGNIPVFHGPTVQMEMDLWVSAGIPPDLALTAATLGNATLLGQSARIGSIEVGKDANLLLVDGNPLADIRALSRISLVVLKGERVGRLSLLKDED
jgi:imidazolonepropionase-like amidohydrolase/ABC-type multidrug transport system permease subunit